MPSEINIIQYTKIFLASSMAKLIIEPKMGKDGIEYTVTYHDPKSDNSFLITSTPDLAEALDRLKSTLESEVATMTQKK
jgi:hypothetical protein